MAVAAELLEFAMLELLDKKLLDRASASDEEETSGEDEEGSSSSGVVLLEQAKMRKEPKIAKKNGKRSIVPPVDIIINIENVVFRYHFIFFPSSNFPNFSEFHFPVFCFA